MKRTLCGFFISVALCGGPAQAGFLYTIQEDGDFLQRINTDTLQVSTVGPLGVTFNFGGLEYVAGSDTLYMIDGRGSQGLYTVNRTTGAASLVGIHGINDLFGLAFDSTNNVMYGTQYAGGSGLYSLNLTTGAATLIANMGVGIGGLAYDSLNDRLVGITDGAGDLYSINRSTGARTLLFDGPFQNDSGLAFDHDQNLFWDIDWAGELYTYDPTNGFNRTTELSAMGSHDGLAYVIPTVSLSPSQPV